MPNGIPHLDRDCIEHTTCWPIRPTYWKYTHSNPTISDHLRCLHTLSLVTHVPPTIILIILIDTSAWWRWMDAKMIRSTMGSSSCGSLNTRRHACAGVCTYVAQYIKQIISWLTVGAIFWRQANLFPFNRQASTHKLHVRCHLFAFSLAGSCDWGGLSRWRRELWVWPTSIEPRDWNKSSLVLWPIVICSGAGDRVGLANLHPHAFKICNLLEKRW